MKTVSQKPQITTKTPNKQSRTNRKDQLPSYDQMLDSLLLVNQQKYSDKFKKKFQVTKTCKYLKKDYTIPHEKEFLFLSLFQPEQKNNKIILYLHSLGSNKQECFFLINHLPKQFCLASFDYIGSGEHPAKHYSSYGLKESQQAASVIKWLEKRNYRVFVWGTSLGAATALKCGMGEVIVADSPFMSFKKASENIVQKATKQYPHILTCLLKCCFSCIFYKVRKDIFQKANVDVEKDLNIEKAMKAINPKTFVIFLVGDQDWLTPVSHSQRLFQAFPGKGKYIQIMKNVDHSSDRPKQLYLKTMKKIQEYQYKEQKPQQEINNTEMFIEMKPIS